VCAPRPIQRPRPPILVGGGGTGLLAVAAAEADIVNIVPPTADGASDPEAVRRFTLTRFQARAARLRKLAEDAGRDPASLTLSALFFVQIADSEGDARGLLEGLAGRYRLTLAEAERFPLGLIGTPAGLRERLAERVSVLGLGYVVLAFATPEAVGRFAEEVLPKLA
jgi:alkanesulfonate monooxygenase SsuD/methylene tetrahydromethanopterin reductase-like flavin-dependent oxidoreductase (luciferase family)